MREERVNRALGRIAELLVRTETKPRLNEILEVLADLDRRAYEAGMTYGGTLFEDEEARAAEIDSEQQTGEREWFE